MAPEQYHGDGDWDIAVDYWALGLIAFELVTRTPLEHFCAERVPEMTPSPEYSRAIGDAVRRACRQHPSMHPDLRDLIVELVVDDPRTRAGLARVREARSRIATGIDVPAEDDFPGPTEPAVRDPSSSAPAWISQEEMVELEANLSQPPRGPATDGAFERLVGTRRARRHREEER